MSPFSAAILLLGLSSLTTAVNFTQVFEWNEWDYELPSEESRTKDETFKLKDIDFSTRHSMAVYGERIFLSLFASRVRIPVSLVSLPTSSASSSPPKLNPFPSLDMHRWGDCNKLERASGLDVDSVGRLWVLDIGSYGCGSKIMIINLTSNDQTSEIHRLTHFHDYMHDLVLDETANGTFAYIPRQYEQLIFVFSLERNETWDVFITPRIGVYSMALSPKDQEPRQLYLCNFDTDEMYMISVAALHSSRQRSANLQLIGNWTTNPYKMLVDYQGTMYVALSFQNYIFSWNTSLKFEEQHIHRVAVGQHSLTFWPFSFVLDQNGIFWMTVFEREGKPRYRLLKAAVGAKSSEPLPVTSAIPTTTTISPKSKPTSVTSKESILTTTKSLTPAEKTTAPSELQEGSIQTEKSPFKLILIICSAVFILILFSVGVIIFLKKKGNHSLSQNTDDSHEITFFRDNHHDENSRSPSPDLLAAENSQPATGEGNESDACVAAGSYRQF